MRKLTVGTWSGWASAGGVLGAICLALVLSGVVDPAALLAEADPSAAPKEAATEPANPETPSDDAADAKPSDAKPLTGVDAAKVLSDARAQLVRYQPIQASIVETVAIGDRKFKAKGTYVQGNDFKLRLEYSVDVGGTQGTLLEVCDGQVLWSALTFTLPPVPDDAAGEPKPDAQAAPPAKKEPRTTTRVTRRDVAEILKAANSGQTLPDSQLTMELGLGGLPGLLASLEQSMTFNSVVEETLNDRTFTVLDGGWNSDFLQAASKKTYKDGLPRHIPDRVRVYLEKETRFPRRIEYRKQDASGKFSKPMVALDFNDVVVNAVVNDQQFEYSPPDGAELNDITKLFIDRMHRKEDALSIPEIPNK